MRLHEFGKRASFDIFHDDVGELLPFIHKRVFCLDDVRMTEVRCEFNVLQTLFGEFRLLLHKSRFQNFDGENGVHDRLLDEIHFTDAACSEAADDFKLSDAVACVEAWLAGV